MSARQHEYRGGAGDSGNLGYPRRPEPGAVLLSTCHRPDQRTRSNLTANSTEHLPDWPAQNVGKMLTAFCGCFWLTDQFFDLTGKSGACPSATESYFHLKFRYSMLLGT